MTTEIWLNYGIIGIMLLMWVAPMMPSWMMLALMIVFYLLGPVGVGLITLYVVVNKIYKRHNKSVET